MQNTAPLTEGLSVSDDSGVRRISFASPKANSLNSELLFGLDRAIREASEASDIGSILLESSGEGAFCAGASFEEMERLSSQSDAEEFFMGFGRVVLSMIRTPKLICCRVQGKVVGGGVGLIAAADYVVATQGASARLSELEIGLGPFVIAAPVERRLGRAHFGAMSCDTAWRDTAWCLDKGLFHQVAEDRVSLDRVAMETARRFSAYSPEAVRQWKSVLWEGSEGWEALFRRRAQIVGSLALHRKK